MTTYKNAFLTRFADSAGLKNASFLSMYAPEIIKSMLENEELLLLKASWLIGIPGSGKSSILRIFCSEILKEIIKHKELYSHLYEPLVDAGIISDNSISTAGIYVHIDELFFETSNVNLTDIDNSKLFFTLFDLRVAKQILIILKDIWHINNKKNEQGIINAVKSDRLPPQIFSQNVSFETFDKLIKEQERCLSKVLTSFPGSPVPELLQLHNRFSSFDLIDSQQLFHDIKFVLMIDDVHELYPSQLKLLKDAVEKRNSFPRWIASRKHIYPIQSLIGDSTGIIDGREITVVDIDLKLSKNKSLYRRFIKNIAEKRLNLTPSLSDFSIEQIDQLLCSDGVDVVDNPEDVKRLQSAEIRKLEKENRFTCQEITDLLSGETKLSPLEIELIIIKANRFIRKRQLSMFPVLNPFLKEIPSKDKQAAELFWKKRAKIPLYSGFNNIVEASNYNVEQFLRVFSPFVDRLIYRVQLDKDLHIKPSEQYKILQRAAKSYLENIISKLLYGKLIYRFVDNLGRYFSHRTYEPNAPHAPGITQFAINSSDMDRISKKTNHKDDPWIDEIIRVLTIAISNNVIVPENSQHQGAKGSEKKYLFSLNRLLCINYDLPMQRGDFQLFTLDFLWEICNNSFKPDEIKRRKLNMQQKLWE